MYVYKEVVRQVGYLLELLEFILTITVYYCNVQANTNKE